MDRPFWGAAGPFAMAHLGGCAPCGHGLNLHSTLTLAMGRTLAHGEAIHPGARLPHREMTLHHATVEGGLASGRRSGWRRAEHYKSLPHADRREPRARSLSEPEILADVAPRRGRGTAPRGCSGCSGCSHAHRRQRTVRLEVEWDNQRRNSRPTARRNPGSTVPPSSTSSGPSTWGGSPETWTVIVLRRGSTIHTTRLPASR